VTVKRFADTAAEFVPAVERVFGERPRILDGARAVLLGERALKLQLEAGERELWLIERRGPLERRVGFVPVAGSIEAALREARSLVEQTAEQATRAERAHPEGSDPFRTAGRFRP
jgi:hypothetical protein